jgi:hypothetical protein
MTFDDLPDQELTFSLEEVRQRVRADIPPIDQMPLTGGFHFRYDADEWRIPATELQHFVDYLMSIGVIDEAAVARLRDRRAGRERFSDLSGERRLSSDRRQTENLTAPRRRMSDYLDM